MQCSLCLLGLADLNSFAGLARETGAACKLLKVLAMVGLGLVKTVEVVPTVRRSLVQAILLFVSRVAPLLHRYFGCATVPGESRWSNQLCIGVQQ